jgi:RimJ/RimL family protein N-acetyltransferase
MSVAPVIETKRLRLRAHTLEDFEATAGLWSDENVTRFIGGKPSTREDSWRRLQSFVGHWHLMGHGYWLIEERASGAYVGDGGFGSFKRDLGDFSFDVPEQGWALAPPMYGMGYATEAAAAQIAWGERHFGRSDFVCMIAPQNAPSLRVAEKLGYREYARVLSKGEDSVLLRRA